MRSAGPLFHPAVALTILAAIALTQPARADDELAHCSTQSARSPDEILVPLSDNPNDPPGVTIVVGETLCIAGSLDRDEELRPHIADSDEPTLVLLRLAREDGVPVLYVRTPPGRWLNVGMAAIDGPANLLSFRPSLHLHPDVRDVRVPLRGHDRWLLSMWDFREPPSPVPRPPRVDSPARRLGDVGITALGGARHVSLGGFDAPLRASGYAPFPRMLPSAGLGVEFALRRWRLELGLERTWAAARALRGSGSVDADIVGFLFDAGYEFLRWRGLTGFVLGGIAGDGFTIDAGGPSWTYLASTAAALGGTDRVTKDVFEVALQTGLQETIPFHSFPDGSGGFALNLSMRGGYTLQLGRPRAWSTKTSVVDGPPGVDLSGPWVFFGIEWSVYVEAP